MQKSNMTRGDRALTMISAHGYTENVELESAISDVLTDLIHLTANRSLDFDSLLSVGQSNFDAEIREDAH